MYICVCLNINLSLYIYIYIYIYKYLIISLSEDAIQTFFLNMTYAEINILTKNMSSF